MNTNSNPSSKTTVTFVTSLLHLLPGETVENIIINITLLASTQINLCVFISPEYESLAGTLSFFSNIKIMRWISLKNTHIFEKYGSLEGLKLPAIHNPEKDTFEYIFACHAKHEFLEETIRENPFRTAYFAWVDFNIVSLFKNKRESLKYLEWLSRVPFSRQMLLFPGCWEKSQPDKIDELANIVHWRFCGGFLLGDEYSILDFIGVYREAMEAFIEKYKTLTWDFNLWAWAETVYCDKWNVTWYRGDHSDNIFSFSGDYMVRNLTLSGLDGYGGCDGDGDGDGYDSYIHKKTYDYVEIPTYYPTSASYLFFRGKHLLNTRYVNYWIYPSGCYQFNSGKRLIENKNIYSELSDDDGDYNPLFYAEMEECVGLPSNRDCLSVGLEDIRLYEYSGEVKYVATTIGYSPEGKSRIICGKYNIETQRIEGGTIIRPPENTWCEKNWIPIVWRGEEMFIYRWFPLEIGKMADDGNGGKRLDICVKHEIDLPLFKKIRGSSIFVETEEGYLGVVHYSEEHSPRHYYHMLVLLDKESLNVIRYSELFVFEKLGIEFCIGFTIRNKMEYVFWISRHDRDPITLRMNAKQFNWSCCV